MRQLEPIKEWVDVDRELFFDRIYPANKPAVLRGLVHGWPVVQSALDSTSDAVDYICSFDSHAPAYTIVGEPDIKGRFFYSDDFSGVNFQRTQAAITAVLEQLLGMQENPNPHAVAIQAASIAEVLPGFEQHNANPVLDASIAPTMWLGNRALVAPHYDVHDNIACVALGRRRFTLFPPEQIDNLYLGPFLNAPGGVPISTVDLREPDLQKHPRFQSALASAQQATLEPGDAIFIPSPWWHAVESLEAINVLVNYWWGCPGATNLSQNHSLMHSMLSIANLSAAQRESWRHYFDYFVFKGTSDPSEHLPNDLQDLVTSMSPEQRQQVVDLIKSKLS